MSVKMVLATVLTNEALQRFKPVEMLPFVSSYAGEVEILLGVAAMTGIVMRKVESPIAVGISAGFVVSGVTKTLDKYFPKAK